MPLSKCNGADHSPGLCFAMFAAFAASAVCLVLSGPGAKSYQIFFLSEVIADWG